METIKLLELFSGIQSQERALRQLGIPYESVGVCDCDKDVLVSSAAMRFDLEKEIENYKFPSVEVMIKELQDKNIGYSFEKQKHTITSRTPITKLRQYYISDKLLKNLGDISKVDKLPRANFVTYSSPCQSFSVAGKLAGAAKTCTKCGHKWDIDFSNPDYNYQCPMCGNASLESTTSGLLQEVQRLLSVAYEENELPEFLLLENVKNLVGKKFIGQFEAWVKWLDSIGYNTYWKVLNGKNYGIPQNRERVFAISIRKDIDTNGFIFPETIPLTTRLKDMLEKNVPEKYYLPDERIEKILNSSFIQEKKRIQTTDVCDTLLARDWKDPKCVPVEEDINPIRLGGLYDDEDRHKQAGSIFDKDAISPALTTMEGGNRMPLIVEDENWSEYRETGYYISNTGLVKCKDGSIKSPREDKYGYDRVNLYINGENITKTVHQLVAETFLPNPFDLPQINHIDGNKKNNNVYNLEWCTAQENIDHKKIVLRNTGSKPNQLRGVYYNKEKCKWEAQIKINNKSTYLGRFNTKEEAYECYRKKFIQLNGYEPWDLSDGSDDIKVIGNYMPSGHDASRVVDIDGIAPTVKENHGTVTAIAEPQVGIKERFFRQVAETIMENQCEPGDIIDAFNKKVNHSGICPTITTHPEGFKTAILPIVEECEPFIVASRGRNPENPSDRTTGAPTEQRLEPNFSGCTNTLTSVQKDNYVCEPQVLRAERTEYGKAIRKQYEAGEVDEKIGNMREMKPRTDGIANTITTVLKDNYVIEAKDGKNLWTDTQKQMITEDGNVKRYINSDVVDEFNVGDCADISFPNGYNKANRVFDGYAPAINGTTTQSSFIVKEPMDEKVAIIEDQFPGSRDARIYPEYSPTLRQNCSGLKVANGEIRETIKWRIRKLTPKCCWRLMNFTDEDHDRAAKYTSASARYKQAGNSIIVSCLTAIMCSLFIEDGYKADVWTKYMLHYWD